MHNIIVKNLTAQALPIKQLNIPNGEIPASGQASISNFNSFWEIQESAELLSYIQDDKIIFNVDSEDLTKNESLALISFPSKIQKAYSWDISTTPETTFQDKISRTSPSLEPGTYEIAWNAEITLNNGELGCGVRAILEVDGVERAEKNWDKNQWDHFGGNVLVDFGAGATPTIKIRYRVVGTGGDTAGIRRASIAIARQPN